MNIVRENYCPIVKFNFKTRAVLDFAYCNNVTNLSLFVKKHIAYLDVPHSHRPRLGW